MQEEINKACAIMQAGGIILYPTDTIWGIGCDALNAAAIQKIYELKQRPDSKSLIILLADPKDIFSFVAAPPPDIVGILDLYSDRPTTVIYDQAVGLPDNLVNKEDGSIAIRITKDPFCKRIIKKTGHPLVSTSANISNSPSAKSYAAIQAEIKLGVDYIVDYRREDTSEQPPSRIIKINQDGSIKVIRS